MSEEQKNNEVEEQEIPDEEVKDTDKTPDSIPYDRFSEVIEEKNTYKSENESLKSKIKELLGEGEEEEPDDEVNQVVSKYAKKQVENLPQEYQSLLQMLPPVKQLEWLTENGDKLNKPSGIPKNPDGTKPGDLSEDQKRKKALRTF